MMAGLYQKYIITKSDGTPVDPNAQYFVLRLDTDSHARQAALAYARSIGTFNKKLAIDLLLWVTEIEEKITKGEQ